MKLICCQFDIAWENKAANFKKVRALLGGTHVPKRSLVLLPEMFSTGFSMNVTETNEDARAEAESFLSELARDLEAFVLGGVVRTAPTGKGLNQAVAFSPAGEEIGRYTKMQPFTLGTEAEHYEAGHAGIAFDWEGAIVAPFICYDLRFPELFRRAVPAGAEIFPVIANWPVARIQHWITLLQARAIENQAFVAGVNRCGNDPKLSYNGRSLIIDPHGNILADAGEREGVISANVDLAALRQWRKDFPALRDMRED